MESENTETESGSRKRKLDEDEAQTSTYKSKKLSSIAGDFLTVFQPMTSSVDSVKFEEVRRIGLHLSYCERFLPKSVVDSLLEFCERNIRYQDGTKLKVFGKWHSIPRKQVAFGDDGMMYGFSGTRVPAEKWPPEIEAVKNYVSKVAGTEFNFVLVNRYADGNDHIGEHRDDEKELDPGSCIASLSIGQPRDFLLRHETRVRKVQNQTSTNAIDKESVPENVTLTLRHGSLLLMRPPTNKHWYHSLPVRKKALGVRINFTFRRVIKV